MKLNKPYFIGKIHSVGNRIYYGNARKYYNPYFNGINLAI